MAAKEQVLIYECISAGGLGTSAADAELLAQGVAMRDALAGDLARLDGVAVSCVTCDAVPLSAALGAVRAIRGPAPRAASVDEFTPASLPATHLALAGQSVGPALESTHPSAHDPASDAAAAACDFLRHAARDFDHVWVVAPESDGLLARFADAVGAPRWVGCSPAAIRLASSKTATRTRLAEHRIAVPTSWWPGVAPPASVGCWVVKPDDGAGSIDTFLHASFAGARADHHRRLTAGRPSTLEAWVPGIPLSLSLLCANGRAELLSINAQQIEARPGAAVVYRGVETAAHPIESKVGRRLAALAQTVLDAVPGLAGYVGIDLVWRQPSTDARLRDDGEPVVIEINPRLTCAYVGLPVALGRNLAGEILRAGQPSMVPHVLH